MEIELVESALKGDTVAGAASFAMKEQAVKAEQIGEAADIIEAACCCGIPEMVAYATDILQGLSVEAAGFMEPGQRRAFPLWCGSATYVIWTAHPCFLY